MAIYLPGTAEDQSCALDELTPREIVAELDKYVVGQKAAKRAVAIALRNRMRRQKLSPEMADEVMPKNIIMIGPTGVGKTEIARRLAKLTNSPFLKVEASKFTEVGYVGRDVESMIRDLVEIAIDMVREEKLEDVEEKAEMNAEERLLDLLLPPSPAPPRPDDYRGREAATVTDGNDRCRPGGERSHQRTREKLRAAVSRRQAGRPARWRSMCGRGIMPSFEIISNQGIEDMDINFKDMLPNIFGQRTKKRKMKVAEAFEYLVQEEEGRLIDMDQVTRLAVERVEQLGHHLPGRDRQNCGARRRARTGCFARGRAAGHSADRGGDDGQHALRDGADGSHSVHCGRGVPCFEAQRSDSGVAGPVSDPRGAAVADGGGFRADSDGAEVVADEQYMALLETEGLKLEFTPEALAEMAQFAFRVNETTENIGARRLHTIMERVLDEISFSAPDLTRAQPKGDQKDQGTMVELAAGRGDEGAAAVIERETANGTEKVMVIDPEYVRQMVADIVKNQDLSRYIL